MNRPRKDEYKSIEEYAIALEQYINHMWDKTTSPQYDTPFGNIVTGNGRICPNCDYSTYDHNSDVCCYCRDNLDSNQYLKL